ncbi:MAG: hypothetical protein JW810_09935 [Sedimentisphaerales bacterium]|nr:hypothetical protein [Sedimentisphaerales bacterium]
MAAVKAVKAAAGGHQAGGTFSMANRLSNILFFWARHLQARRPRRQSHYLHLRRRIAAMLLLVLVISSSSYFWYFTTDKRIRSHAIEVLEKMTGGQVTIRSASLNMLQEIRIQGVEVFLPGRPAGEQARVFAAEDVLLHFAPWSILAPQLRVRDIIAYRPQLQIWYDHDLNTINLEQLDLMKQPLAHPSPTIRLEQGTISYYELMEGRPTRQASQTLWGKIYPLNDSGQGIGFVLYRGNETKRNPFLLQGRYYPQQKKLETDGNFHLREMTEYANLPERVTRWKEMVEISDPSGTVTTHSLYEPGRRQMIRLEVRQGALKLPVPATKQKLPLHGVNASVLFTPEAVTIENLDGQYESFGRFRVNGSMEGYRSDSPFSLRIRADEFQIPADQWSGGPDRPVEIDWTPPDGPPSDSSPANASPSDARLINVPPPDTPPSEKSPTNLVAGPLGPLLGLVPDLSHKIASYRPTGTFGLEIEFRRPAAGDDIAYEVKLNCRNARGHHQGFPYALENINGTLTFQPGRIVIGPLDANQQGHRINLEGLHQHDQGQDLLELKIRTENTPLDGRLYAVLAPWQQRLWDQFDPAGTVDGSCQLQVKDQREVSFRQFRADLNDVRMQYRGLPVPVDSMRGYITYEQDAVHFEIPQARAREGSLEMRGDITRLHDGRPQIDGTIDFQDVRLDASLGDCLPDSVRPLYEQIHLEGQADGTIKLQSRRAPARTDGAHAPDATDPNLPLHYEIEARIHDGRMRLEQIPYPLEQVEAQVSLNRQRLNIKHLQGKHGTSHVTVTGELSGPRDYRLEVHADPLELEADLAGALGPQGRRLWDQWQPGGSVELTLKLAEEPPSSQRPDEPQKTYDADITLRNCRLRPQRFAYPFDNVNGSLEISPEKIVIPELTSRREAMSLRLDGTLLRQQQDYRLHLTGESIPMDEQLTRAVPASFRALGERVRPAGTVDTDLHIVHGEPNEASGEWIVTGHSQLHGCGLDRPLSISDIEGRLEGQIKFFPAREQLSFTGNLNAGRLQIEQRPTTNLQAEVAFQQPQGRLTISNLSGTFCQGRLAGDIQMRLAEEHFRYEAKLQFSEADLLTLLGPDMPENLNRQNLKGRWAGWINLGQQADEASRRGTFLFLIQEAVLGELPIAAQILYVLNLSLPREGAFNEASLTGDIIGPKIRFDPIHLRGSALGLTGVGQMSGPDHQLDMVFVVDSPHRLPQIPVISSFMEAMKGELAQVWVTGTFYEPQVEPVAFPSLEEALRQLNPNLPAALPKNRPNQP